MPYAGPRVPRTRPPRAAPAADPPPADPPAPAPARRRRRGRPALAAAVTAGVLAALVVLAVTKIDLAEVGHSLARVNGWWVAGAVALMATAFLARGESWFTAVHAALPGAGIRRPVVMRILLIGMAGSTVAPGRVGEAARAYLLARRAGGVRASLATAVGTLLSQTLLNVLALAILTGIALGGSAIRGAHSGSLLETAALPALAVVVLAGAPALGARAGSIRWRPLRAAATWIQRQLVDVRRGLRTFRMPGAALRSGGFQLTAWGLQLAMCYVVLLAFGLDRRAGIPAAAAVLVAVNITAVIPVTPSNVGVFQAACIAVLAPFGVSAGQGLAYGLVLQAVEIACALGLGLPALVREGITLSDLGHRARRVRGATVDG